MSATRVFISWSGAPALAIAHVWVDLLNDVFDDSVDPFISDDIDAGARGLDEIRQALEGARFAIAIVTRANQKAQWLNFEVGAVANQLRAETGESTRVAPFLVDFERDSDVVGPITQFQMKKFSREGVEQIVMSLAGVLGASQTTHRNRFDLYWTNGYEKRFDDALATVKDAYDEAGSETPPARGQDDVLDEVLSVVRDLRSASLTGGHARRSSKPEPRYQFDVLSAAINGWANGASRKVPEIDASLAAGGGTKLNITSRDLTADKVESLVGTLFEVADQLGFPRPEVTWKGPASHFPTGSA